MKTCEELTDGLRVYFGTALGLGDTHATSQNGCLGTHGCNHLPSCGQSLLGKAVDAAMSCARG